MSPLRRRADEARCVEVLVIEDDLAYRRLVERWLSGSREFRFHLRFAARLDEAWHRIGASDLILLDLGLPDATGMETLVAARDLAHELPIVVVSGLEGGDLGRRALRAGADGFVPKHRAASPTLHVALRLALRARLHGARRTDSGPESAADDFWVDARYGASSPRPR